MKKFVTIFGTGWLLLGMLSITMAADYRQDRSYGGKGRSTICAGEGHLSGVSIDFEDGSLILADEDAGERIEITDDYRLLINGKRIKTDRRGRKLLGQYYQQVEQIIDGAVKIGFSAGMVGVQGAELGIKAAAVALTTLFLGDEDQSMERKLERQTAKLEAQAEKLEEQAEEIEEMAEQLEETADDLNDHFPALRRIDWF